MINLPDPPPPSIQQIKAAGERLAEFCKYLHEKLSKDESLYTTPMDDFLLNEVRSRIASEFLSARLREGDLFPPAADIEVEVENSSIRLIPNTRMILYMMAAGYDVEKFPYERSK